MWRILRKDLILGPRSSFFLFAILLPVALTVILQLAFGALLAPHPRLALFDAGSSAIPAALARLQGFEVEVMQDEETLLRRVKANHFDAGLVLPQGFDEAVRYGGKPALPLLLSRESHASNRFLIRAQVLAAVREVVGDDAPADVELVTFGDAGVPLSLRLLPVIVFYALAMAGIFVPGSSLVEEKERGTLVALLVSPAKLSEVLVAKWVLGFSFASVMSAATLALNQALGPRPLEGLVVVAIAAALTSVLGLLVGVAAKDSAMLFGLIKGAGLLLFAPALFYLFPDWPQWVARVFPLYWIIEPIWRVSVMGEPIQVVWVEVAVALGLTGSLLFVVVQLSGRLRRRMAAG